MNHRFSIVIIYTTFLLTAAAGPASAGALALYDPGQVSSIAAVSNLEEPADQPFRSGLFVSYLGDDGGHIAFFSDRSIAEGYLEYAKPDYRWEFQSPVAIAAFHTRLLVWDGSSGGELWLLEPQNEVEDRRLIAKTSLEINPSQIAVSPDGLVVVLDESQGQAFWVPLQGGEFQPLEFKTESRSIAFLSFFEVAVLDRNEQVVEIISFEFDGNEINVTDRDFLLLANKLDEDDFAIFHSISAKDGVLYIADKSRIYSYLDSTDTLLLAADYSEGLSGIEQFAVSADSFFVVDRNGFEQVTRSIPYGFEFKGGPQESQLALLDLYAYLRSNALLAFEPVPVTRNYKTLEELLIGHRLFIAPWSIVSPQTTTRQQVFRKRKAPPRFSFGPYDRQYLSFIRVFCAYNESFCEGEVSGEVLFKPVESGSTLTLPNLRTNSKLDYRQVVLRGQSIAQHLNAAVISAENKERVYKSLGKQNRGKVDASDPVSLNQSRGEFRLPFEIWTVRAAISVQDAYGDSRGVLTDYPGVNSYSLRIATKQKSYSHHLPSDPAVSASTNCQELNARHEEWIEKIQYPIAHSAFTTSTPRIGVIEHRVTQDHQIFTIAPSFPAWYTYSDDEVDLVAVPINLSASPQQVNATDVYVEGAHHGTHVSALIGGREGPCWSGLLPRAQLFHMKPSEADINQGLFAANNAFVTTINISVKLDETPDGQFRKLLLEDDTYNDLLYVVAAGNSSTNLNTDNGGTVAQWGDKGNIIVVTSVKFSNGLPDIPSSANTGKKLVDIAAPGVEIYSATAHQQYGAASGTSQATPAVTAVAGFLRDEEEGGGKSPGQVKARLIATADWKPNWDNALDGKVWGGVLNAGDAVRFPERNIFRTTTDGHDVIFSLESPRGKLVIENRPVILYQRSDIPLRYNKKLNLRSIVSIKDNEPYKNDAGENVDPDSYRVVFVDPSTRRLEIIKRAKLSGEIKCESAKKWDAEAETWEDSNWCDQPIDIRHVLHFFHAMTYNVNW